MKSVEEEWNFFIVLFEIFVGYVPNERPLSFLQKLRRKMLITFRTLWDIFSVFYLTILIFIIIRPPKAGYYLHALDMSLLFMLRFIMRLRGRKIIEAINKISSLRYTLLRVNIKYINITWLFCFLIFITFCNVILNLGNILLSESTVNRLTVRFTFGCFRNPSQTKLPLMTKLYVYLITCLVNVWGFFIPVTSVTICCFAQISHFRLFHSYNKYLRDTIQSARLSEKSLCGITFEFRKLSQFVKRVNDHISPLAFMLMAYYAINICYLVSRMMTAYNTTDAIVSISCIVLFGFHFVALVLASSEVDREMLRTEAIVLKKTWKNPADVLLAMSMLHSFSDEASLKPMGMFKLERKLILVFLGLVMSYGMMILPYLK